MNHDNISKIYKNNGTNDDHSNSCYITEKTHMISKSEVSYYKYGNKTHLGIDCAALNKYATAHSDDTVIVALNTVCINTIRYYFKK